MVCYSSVTRQVVSVFSYTKKVELERWTERSLPTKTTSIKLTEIKEKGVHIYEGHDKQDYF